MKKLTGSLCLTLVVTALWGAEAPKDVFVEAGGETFVISATRPIQRCARNRREQVLSMNIRVAGEAGVAALEPDWRGGALIEVVENTDERCVVHTEHPLRICELKAGAEPKPFDAATLTIDYVFRKDLAGVIAVERLIVVKPFNFISWNVPLSPTMVKYAVDKVDLVTYPTKAEFRATQGGYGTKAGAYVLGQEPYGDLWFMGREFTTFCPAGEGKGSFYASCDTHAAGGHGKSVVPGEVITVCVCVGIVKDEGDIDRYRAFRKGDTSLPVAKFAGDWNTVPQVIWRGETVDYRPKAGLDWEGKDDLSFSLKLAQDEKGIHVFADVTDNFVRNTFSGEDTKLGDSVQIVFADAAGKNTYDRVISALEAEQRDGGYVVKTLVDWETLERSGIRKTDSVRFNLCVADQDKGTNYENWMGIEDGVMGGRDPQQWRFLDFSGVQTTFIPERPALPSKDEMKSKMDRIAAMNAKLPSDSKDEYTSCLKAMTEYFLDFMEKDLNCGETVRMSHLTRKVDDAYRYYMNDRVNKNADYLLILQKELAQRQAELASGKIQPIITVKYPKGVRAVIEDGGFKVNGKELMLIGPDTWTNVSGWDNADIDWIGRTGFNQIDCFYIGGTNYWNVVRACEERGLYCVWGSAAESDADFWNKPDPCWDWDEEKQNAFRNGMGFYMGSMVPSNPPPNFVFQIAFPEQWDRKYEATEVWADEFRAYLKDKFGSIEGLNATLATSYANWTNIDFSAALKNDALKYESFVYRMQTNVKKNRKNQEWIAKRFGLPRSTHYSTHYNICGLDPLVVLADFEAHWGEFDVVGFDGGYGLLGSEWAFDFPKGGFELDFARSCYPSKPVANNEDHVVEDGTYNEHTNAEIYLSHFLAYLQGRNSSSVWDWANTRHTYGEYVFTRAHMYHEMVRCALDLRRYPEEVAAFRRCPNPPFRIFHSLPSLAERDPYVRSLYSLYGATSFTGWATRFVTERDLAKHDTKDAKVIIVPDARRVSETTFEALADFAAKGGIVLVDGDKALAKDEWGKVVPERAAKLSRFRKFAEPSSRARFETLNSALAEKGEKPPLAVTTVDGKAPFGVMWRTGKTAAGEKMAFVTNLSKQPVTVKIAKPGFFGKWTELLRGRDVSGEVRLEPLDLLMLKN